MTPRLKDLFQTMRETDLTPEDFRTLLQAQVAAFPTGVSATIPIPVTLLAKLLGGDPAAPGCCIVGAPLAVGPTIGEVGFCQLNSAKLRRPPARRGDHAAAVAAAHV